MGFTKTIIQRFSNTTPFSFIDFVRGTLSLIQYGIDNRINVAVNLESSPFSQFLITENYNTHNFSVGQYYSGLDSETLYIDLENFKDNSSALLVVCTNWAIHPGRISKFALTEFKRLIQFTREIYTDANLRVARELLNINLPHTDPVIELLSPELSIPGDYSIIYVDINSLTAFNKLDTLRLADFIRSSLILTKNIILLSNDKRMKLWLSDILEVNYIPGPGNEWFGPINSWNLKDDIVNFILLAESKRVYVFTEQALSVNKEYEYSIQMVSTLIQRFTFFYSKVDISPMPGFYISNSYRNVTNLDTDSYLHSHSDCHY